MYSRATPAIMAEGATEQRDSREALTARHPSRRGRDDKSETPVTEWVVVLRRVPVIAVRYQSRALQNRIQPQTLQYCRAASGTGLETR